MPGAAAPPFPVLVFHSVADRPGSSIWTLPTGDFRRHARAIAASIMPCPANQSDQ